MKFKPIAKRYQFDDVLSMTIESHLKEPIANWIYAVLKRKQALVEPDGIYRNYPYITTQLKEILHVNLREVYPQKWGSFIEFVLSDNERTLVILQWCLNYFARSEEANDLEWALSNGGSAYAVEKVNKDASEYVEGVYDLVERVPEPVKAMAKEALSNSEQLLEGWRACYGKNPNYKETVQQSQNVLEELLRDNYLPSDKKAQLGKLIKDIRAGKTLSYKGSDVVKQPNTLLELIQNIPEYRGMHTAGTGKNPTKQQAEYILHTTIYFWNLHQDRSKKK